MNIQSLYPANVSKLYENLYVFFQFIDLCILLGCDYCESIRGIGPKRAIDLIKRHKTIENIVEHIDKKVGINIIL